MEPKTQVAGGVTRWRGRCAYIGHLFEGWQSQPNGRAVQDVIEKALADILGAPVRVHGSSRTDSGVHARDQALHFDAAWRHGGERLEAALRAHLPPELRVWRLEAAAPSFHARFSARGKRYRYRVHLGPADPFVRPYVWERRPPLDLEEMRRAAALLVGRHDFTAFAAAGDGEMADGSAVKCLWRVGVLSSGKEVQLVFEGSGFLYRMCRSLAGALVSVGQGALRAEDLSRLLSARQRTAEVVTAPACGLILERVYFRPPAAARQYACAPGG